MKAKIIFSILLFPFYCLGQEGFFIGGNAGIGLNWLNNSDNFKKQGTENFTFDYYIPGNNQIGFLTGFGFNDKMSINFNLGYKHLRQDYRFIDNSTFSNRSGFEYYSTLQFVSLTTEFKYNFKQRDNHLKSFFIRGGLHLSHLFKYDMKGNERINGNDYWSVYGSENGVVHSYASVNDNDSILFQYKGKSDFIYSKNNFGVDLTFGIKIPLTHHFNMNIELSGMYDLNNIHNLNANLYYADTVNGKFWSSFNKMPEGNFINRKPFHNVFVGLNISFEYFFKRREDNGGINSSL